VAVRTRTKRLSTHERPRSSTSACPGVWQQDTCRRRVAQMPHRAKVRMRDNTLAVSDSFLVGLSASLSRKRSPMGLQAHFNTFVCSIPKSQQLYSPFHHHDALHPPPCNGSCHVCQVDSFTCCAAGPGPSSQQQRQRHQKSMQPLPGDEERLKAMVRLGMGQQLLVCGMEWRSC